MLKKNILSAVVSLLLFFSPAFADTIVLKSGSVVEANILSRDETKIVVSIDDIEVPYFLRDIEKINNEDIRQPSAQPVEIPIEQLEERVFSVESSPPEPETPKIISEHKPPVISSNGQTGNIVVTPARLLPLVIILFFLFVYTAICLYLIAKKTNHGPLWFAWIPVVSLFLTCKIAEVSYFWILLSLTSVLPYVGPFGALVFSSFVWCRIAIILRQPMWIRVFAALPVFNLIVMGYLAFSKDS